MVVGEDDPVGRDLGVRAAARDQPQHLELARRRLVELTGRSRLLVRQQRMVRAVARG
jgi:hypothetical protein